MKKIIAGLMIAASMFTFGCSGRNSDFGTVDMSKIEAGRMRMGIVIQNKRRDAAESFFQKGVRLCTILGL